MTKKLIFLIIGLLVAIIVVVVGFSNNSLITHAKELKKNVTAQLIPSEGK